MARENPGRVKAPIYKQKTVFTSVTGLINNNGTTGDEDQLDVHEWSLDINASTPGSATSFCSLWACRELTWLFVRRDFAVTYKQTILGPFWIVLQPILTTLMFALVFGVMVQLPTNDLPVILFYMAGIVSWTLFADSFSTVSGTFVDHAQLFEKVYFPRIVVACSSILSALIKYLIQLSLFFLVYCYFWLNGVVEPDLGRLLLLVPLAAILVTLSFSMGLIFSAVSSKYRDLRHLLPFGTQLLMYATPVIYSISGIPVKYQGWLLLNPLSALLEGFRYAFFGSAGFEMGWLVYPFVCALLLLYAGVSLFQSAETKFMDTV